MMPTSYPQYHFQNCSNGQRPPALREGDADFTCRIRRRSTSPTQPISPAVSPLNPWPDSLGSPAPLCSMDVYPNLKQTLYTIHIINYYNRYRGITGLYQFSKSPVSRITLPLFQCANQVHSTSFSMSSRMIWQIISNNYITGLT